MQIRAGNSRKNDEIQILEGQCCNSSLGMLTGDWEPQQTGWWLPDLCLCTGSPRFVLDGGCAQGPTAVIRGDKCPPADTGGWNFSWGGTGAAELCDFTSASSTPEHHLPCKAGSAPG